ATGLENGGVAAGVPIHFAALSTTVVTGSTGIAIVENSYSVAGTYVVSVVATSGGNTVSNEAVASVTIFNDYHFTISPLTPSVTTGATVKFTLGLTNGLLPASATYNVMQGTAIISSGSIANGTGSFSLSFPTAGTISLVVVLSVQQNGQAISSGITVSVAAPSYTCYNPVCRAQRTATGGTIYICEGQPYTSSTPCPSGHQSASAACAGVTCQ
ncbi:MAG: hypothetical protein QXL94_03360, partial [Candidatus Parvarchaeum sp.]